MLKNNKLKVSVITCSVCLLLLFLTSWKQSKEWEISSPDAAMRVTVFQSANNELNYKVMVFDTNGSSATVIENSRLGLEREDQDFVRDLKMVEFKTTNNIKDEYRLISGKKSHCENVYNQTVFLFKNKKGSLLKIIFRIHNDGIAFRYVFPETTKKVYTVKRELTEFAIPTKAERGCTLMPMRRSGVLLTNGILKMQCLLERPVEIL